uniref:Putative uncharacterized protein PRO2289 n=1 Tax=Homo sapiens TaxID=9606 RepID=YP008_HUMAN|nr:RecName: Full=Putative uncharacterized protein PRO2289 [Homo sapiens]AAF71118.1 PRO2289 [Homo sapiens]
MMITRGWEGWGRRGARGAGTGTGLGGPGTPESSVTPPEFPLPPATRITPNFPNTLDPAISRSSS